MNNLVASFAPELQLLGPDDPPAGGLQEEQGFTADGTPRPYMTNPDGSRRYFGEAVTGIPGVTPQAPAPNRGPIEGIRLRDQAIPYMSNPDDPSGIREYWTNRGFVIDDPSATAQIPPAPFDITPPEEPPLGPEQVAPRRLPNGGAGVQIPEDPYAMYLPPPSLGQVPMVNRTAPPGGLSTEEPADLMQRDPRSAGTRAVLPIPGAQQRPRVSPRADSVLTDPLGDASPYGRNTVGALLERLGITMPRPRAPGPVSGLRERTQPDPNRDLNNPTFDFTNEEGLAEFNRRMGTNFGRQLRTIEEQRDLYERGLTPTMDSDHLYGASFDWPGSQLVGPDGRRLTDQAAIDYVRQRLVSAGYAVDNLEFRWETGRGRNQGTGSHVHVERIIRPEDRRLPPQE